MSPSLLAISLFFHITATLVWVGGLLFTAIFVWPEVQRTLADNPALYRVLSRLRKRFYPATNLALVVLIVTGLTQMVGDPNYGGALVFDNDWSKIILLKHVVIVVMVALGALLQFGVTPALERSSLLAEHGKSDPQDWEALRRRERRLTWLSLALGLAVIALSTWAAAL